MRSLRRCCQRCLCGAFVPAFFARKCSDRVGGQGDHPVKDACVSVPGIPGYATPFSQRDPLYTTIPVDTVENQLSSTSTHHRKQMGWCAIGLSTRSLRQLLTPNIPNLTKVCKGGKGDGSTARFTIIYDYARRLWRSQAGQNDKKIENPSHSPT